jgi:hypothetical protein
MSLPIKIEDTDPGYALRPGSEFEFTSKPSNMAASTFTAITPERVIVTRRFTNLESLPAETPIIAHWHGERRTDAFLSTVGELKAKADAWVLERSLRDARVQLRLGASVKDVAKKTKLDEREVRKLAKELKTAGGWP